MIKFPKSMRKKNIDVKTRELIKLGFKENELIRIRNLESAREKLIEAGKLQMKVLKQENCNINAWIAGYSSESIIRITFGSYSNYLDRIVGTYVPSEKWRKQEFSWEDRARKINIPEEITPNLAEETGIHIGDGNLLINRNTGVYRVQYSGNMENETGYYKLYVSKLIKDIYNIDGNMGFYPIKNSCYLVFKSKAIAWFKSEILKLPSGKKINVQIPLPIVKDSELLKNCIRGIFDTDFYFGVNKKRPFFQTQINSDQVKSVIRQELLKLGIECRIWKGILFFGGHDKARKFFRYIGSSNPHNITKYEIWEKFGDLPYYTKYKEREEVLKGAMSFNELVKKAEKRKKAPRAGISS